jgi:phosphoribosylformylglycinamidine cyclo-ligase
MPGFYARGEYDVAGFTVGLVDRPKMITGEQIGEHDVIIGLASSGVHSNGFSLVRKLFPETQWCDSFGTSTLGETLLTPTKIFVKPVLQIIEKFEVRGIAHITGGGFIENIPRAFPGRFKAVITKGSWPGQEIFSLIQAASGLADQAMFNTFNMGIGMVLIVAADKSDPILEALKSSGEEAFQIGRIALRKDGDSSLCFV